MSGEGRDGRGPFTGEAQARAVLADERPPRLVNGEVVAARYRLEQPLGEGGMGVVWSARHVGTQKAVALKFLKADTYESVESRKRFLREARAACAVRHPGVVEVHEVLELGGGAPVMVMDLLQGETLASRLERSGPMPLGEVARIMVPVCAAVGTIHAMGIVHRDLKPDNIFLCQPEDGGTTAPTVKVLDFGIAKLTATEGDAARTGPSTTGTGLLLGTPYYMAPEQMFGERDIDHRADLWAVGVILYEALSGRRPTQASNLGQILKIVAKDGIVPLRGLMPALPDRVLGLVERLLEHNRGQRLADLREVVAVLAAFTDVVTQPFGPPPPVPSSPAISPVSRSVRIDSDDAYAATMSATPMRLADARPSRPSPAPSEPRRPVSGERPVEIRVKGSVLLGLMQASADVDPTRTRETIARQVGPALADALRSGGPMASSWYPVAWHRELLAVVADHGGTSGLRAVVRRSTRDSVGKIHRVVVRVLSPDVLISRSSTLFSSFFEGTFSAQPQGNGRTRVSWKGCHGFDRNCWLAQIHTVEEMVAMSGATILRRMVLQGGSDGDAEMTLEIAWR